MPYSTDHYHVASGLAGYGPDGADGFATFDSLSGALEYAREELLTFIDIAHDSAHAFAEAGQYEDAWNEIVRIETLDVLRANLDPSRRHAPLYRDDDDAYQALQQEQAAQFPHDISDNTRLYLWQCEEPEDCDHDID